MGTEMIGSLFALIHTRCHYTHLFSALSGHNHLELGLIMLRVELHRLWLDYTLLFQSHGFMQLFCLNLKSNIIATF